MTRRKAIPIIKPPITWILVADGRQAQAYTRSRTEKLVPIGGNPRRNQFEEIIARAPAPVPGMSWKAESIDQYDIGRNKTGMVFESANSGRSMSEPHMDVHEEIRGHFARLVGESLNRARKEKSFDRLVLIAPSKMLGEIKKHLDAKVLKCVVAEMPKDLTHYNGEALAEYLGDIA